MPVVQFSIPAAPWERLEKAVVQGESTNQAAKRLLTQVLLGDDSPAPDPDRLDHLEERLEKLESGVKSLALQFSERVYELSQQAQAVDLSPLESALGDLETMACAMQVALESRLSEIERRLDAVPAAAPPSPTRLPKATRRGA